MVRARSSGYPHRIGAVEVDGPFMCMAVRSVLTPLGELRDYAFLPKERHSGWPGRWGNAYTQRSPRMVRARSSGYPHRVGAVEEDGPRKALAVLGALTLLGELRDYAFPIAPPTHTQGLTAQ